MIKKKKPEKKAREKKVSGSHWVHKMKNSSRAIYGVFSERLSSKDQTFFAKRLSFLIDSGIPIVESLHMIHQQTKSAAYKKVITHIIDDINNGQTLSKGLSKFPNMFSVFSINIIKAGEASGMLSDNLNYLADELKKKQALKRKIISALIYPALITVAALGITGFLVIYLFPKIMPVFLSLRIALPLSTRIIIAVSLFLTHWGILFIICVITAVIIIAVIIRKIESIRFLFQKSLLRLPIINSMVQDYNISNATRTLGLLLKSGVPLSSALTITADTTGNLVYRKHWRNIQKIVNKGEQISTYFQHHRLAFPEIIPQMISVGEKSGNLSNSLIYIAEFYEQELDDLTKNFSTLIEPALMIFMGLVIGFIAISIITPIYSITQNLHP